MKTDQIRVKDGETIVIGGLLQEKETNSQGRLPFLSSIPVVGMLFKNSNTTRDRSELILMITPKILKETDAIGLL